MNHISKTLKHMDGSRIGSLPLGCCFLSACLFALPPALGDDHGAADLEHFENRIRPVLVEHCYACHNSVDLAEGDLVLDDRAGLRRGGAGGPIVVPGRPEESRLLAILRHEVEGLEMPVDGDRLDDRVIADFEAWIRAGAPDPRDHAPKADDPEVQGAWDQVLENRKEWWSFQPIVRPEIPRSVGDGASDHPIDRFIDAGLHEAGIPPEGRADPQTLSRRLHFVLTGLPPATVERVGSLDERWYEELVDRLLESPHFGERWARHWMDWIRYAESHGSEGDPPIAGAWQYRDYLIRALNQDVAMDQLIREHVAGDLLEQPRINTALGINESVIGTAHWRMVFHGFSPTDALDERVRFTDDAINSFSKAYLGLTVSCARCHHHKFDPISQDDYYALFGVLASTRPGRAVIDLPELKRRHADRLHELKIRLRQHLADEWSSAGREFAKSLRAGSFDQKQAEKPESPFHLWWKLSESLEKGQDFTSAWEDVCSQFDRRSKQNRSTSDVVQRWSFGEQDATNEWFRHGVGLTNEPARAGDFALQPDGDEVLAGIYPEGIYSHLLSSKHPARLTSPDIKVDGDYELWLRTIGGQGATCRYVVEHYPRNGTIYPVTNLSPTWDWVRFDLGYWQGDQIHVELTSAGDAPLLVKDKDRSWFGVTEAMIVKKGSAPPKPYRADDHLVPFAMERHVSELGLLAEALGDAVDAAVSAWRNDDISDAQAELLNACLASGVLPNRLETMPSVKTLVQEYRRLEAEIPVARRVPSLDEATPRDQPLYQRGDHRKPGRVVPRRFLSAIDDTPYDASHSGRAQLAVDLLRADNPLTRRVLVNRVWHHLMGRGLVETPDNFGHLGVPPTHPELLDYLACYLADHDWSLKALVRHIVTSACYQRSATVSEVARERDPDNRKLAHAFVRRLDAEAIRDSLLSVSGQIDLAMGGVPVSASTPRRSVYTEVIRNSLDPFLRTFDFPEPFATTGRRDATNTPSQSLALLNSEMARRAAGAWAEKVLADESLSSDRDRVENMLARALGRDVTPTEVQRGIDHWESVRSSNQEIAAQFAEWSAEIKRDQETVDSLIADVRRKLALASTNPSQADLRAPEAWASWDFDEAEPFRSAGDQWSDMVLHLQGGASIAAGELKLDGRLGHAITTPLSHSIKEKTLEVWVRLDDLSQQGGGAMSIMSKDGVLFDAIVFGEQSPRQWLAGSNNFARTQAFSGTEEDLGGDQYVHVAITYSADGMVTGYRNGKPYGSPYRSNGPVAFEAHESVIAIGLRHAPAGGNRLLGGAVKRARLYDRALDAEEIAASYQSAPHPPTDEEVLQAMDEDDRETVRSLRSKIEMRRGNVEELGAVPDTNRDLGAWKDLALAIISFKEFIYLR